MIPGQCFLMPSRTLAKRSGLDVGDSSSFLTCTWTNVAPASNASCVDSTCSDTEMGTAGLSFLRGNDPVMATVTMQGVVMTKALLSTDPDARWRKGRAPACTSPYSDVNRYVP